MIKRNQYVKNAIQKNVNCELCSSIISFSGLKSHIKKSHKDIDLAEGIKKEPEYYKYYIINSKLKAKGIDIDNLLQE